MINSSSIVTLPPEIYFSEPNRYISSVTYNPKEKKVEYYKYNNDTDEKEKGYILDLGNIENDIGKEFIPKYLEVK